MFSLGFFTNSNAGDHLVAVVWLVTHPNLGRFANGQHVCFKVKQPSLRLEMGTTSEQTE